MSNSETISQKMRVSLFGLRLSVFLVMIIWVLDKFLRPEHTAKIFEHFYFIPSVSASVSHAIGVLQGLVAIGFLLGIKKNITYGLMLIFHAISTLSSFNQYVHPFEKMNILFFAAWPMLAACYTLYALREYDTRYTV